MSSLSSTLVEAHAVRSRRRSQSERAIHAALLVCVSVSVLTTLGIVGVLAFESLWFFRQVSIVEFLTGTKWTPMFLEKHFGVLPLVCGTLWVAVGSGIVAIPLGLMAAIYLSEYASLRFRGILKPVLEILAGIPSVVYGYFAIVFISPLVQKIVPGAGVFNAVNASIVVAIMIIPTVVSLSEDVLRSVPRSLREAAYALGSTKFEVTTRVVVPAGLSGIMASFLLAISRAIGETMAVTLAAGATPNLTYNPFEGIQTMTAYIVQVSLGDTPAGTIVYGSIFAVCGVLFLMTLGMNLLAHAILARLGEKYE